MMAGKTVSLGYRIKVLSTTLYQRTKVLMEFAAGQWP